MANLLLNTAFTQGSLIEQVSGKTITHNLSTPLTKYNDVYGFDISKLNLSESIYNNRLEISGLVFPSVYTFSFSFNVCSQFASTTPIFNRDIFSTLNQPQQYLYVDGMNLNIQLGTNVYPTVNLYTATNAIVVGLNICIISFNFIAKTLQFNLNNVITNLAINNASNNPNFSTFFRFGFNALTANPSKPIIINSLRIYDSALSNTQISAEYQYHLGLKSVIKPINISFNPDNLKYNKSNIIGDYNFKNVVNNKLYDKSSNNGIATSFRMIQTQDGLQNLTPLNNTGFQIDNFDARALIRTGEFSFHLIFNPTNIAAIYPLITFGEVAGGGNQGIAFNFTNGNVFNVEIYSESRESFISTPKYYNNAKNIISFSIKNSVVTGCVNGIIFTHTYSQTQAFPGMVSTKLTLASWSISTWLTYFGIVELDKFILKNKQMSTAEMQSFYTDNQHTVISENFTNYPVGQLSLPATMIAVNTVPKIIEFPTVISQSTNIWKNTGTPETTDWVDSNADGLADNWSTIGSVTPSIVTGNGFIGNAQRVVAAATGSVGILSTNAGFEQLKKYSYYKVSFKYRSLKSNFYFFTSNVGGMIILPLNTGNAVYIEFFILLTDITLNQISLYTTASAIGDWFEIDELRIFEVLNPIQSKKILEIPNNVSFYKLIKINDSYIYGTKYFTLGGQGTCSSNTVEFFFLSDGILVTNNKPNNGISLRFSNPSDNILLMLNTVNGVQSTLGTFTGTVGYFCKICKFKVIITPATIAVYESNILLLTVNTPTIRFTQKNMILWSNNVNNEAILGEVSVISI